MLFVILATGFSWIAGTGYGCIGFLYWRAYFTGGAREALIGAVIFTAAAYIQTGIAKVQGEIAGELREEGKILRCAQDDKKGAQDDKGKGAWEDRKERKEHTAAQSKQA